MIQYRAKLRIMQLKYLFGHINIQNGDDVFLAIGYHAKFIIKGENDKNRKKLHEFVNLDSYYLLSNPVY